MKEFKSSVITFSDGKKIDTGGEVFRIISKSDGLYVTGRDVLVPVDSREEGKELIAYLKKKEGKETMKKNIIEIKEDIRLPGTDIILEKSDKIRVISEDVTSVKIRLNQANLPYERVEYVDGEYLVFYKGALFGKSFENYEDRFYKIFPNGEFLGKDIFIRSA